METSGGLLPTPTSKSNQHCKSMQSRGQGCRNLRALLTFSPADFHVNHSVKQEKEKELMMTVSSGRKCLESYENSSPHGSSLKTCVAYLLSTTAWYSNKCVLTWKTKVTKSNRLLFQLAPSTPRTAGTECGLLPTHRAGNPGSRPNGKGGKVLAEEIKKVGMLPTATTGDRRSKNSKQQGINNVIEGIQLPTPKASDGHLSDIPCERNRKTPCLEAQINMKMFPTPVASDHQDRWQTKRDWKGAQGRAKKNGKMDVPALVDGVTGQKTGLKLQPAFVEWMMGYPEKWTELPCPKPGTVLNASKPSATPSSRKWRYKFLED